MIYSKRVVVITAAILIIFSVTVTPAYAWSFKDMFHSSSADRDYTKKLTEIEEQIGELSNDPILMKFINRNMHEQKVRVIVIHITEHDEVVGSYYIYRGDKGDPASISSTDVEGLGNSWTFKPTIRQTQTALKILESESLSVRLVLKCISLWISVEKEDDVPSIYDIIDESSWIDTFLPKWW
ncbi:MAG: hypothetical protein KAT48_12670 [Bacteroidales bacterium]|nr:hypothetical protein [Bacteroidales bacterium]